MKIDQLYTKLARDVDELDRAQRQLVERAYRPQDLEIPPKVYLRGMYVQFDQSTECLEIKVNGERYYYPISQYDSAWLPFPGHQVLIFQTDTGPLISGFSAGGKRIPTACREILKLFRVLPNDKLWLFKHADGTSLYLPIPAFLPEGIGLHLGAYYCFKVVDALPSRYYLLESVLDSHGSRDMRGRVLYSPSI